MDRKKVFPVFTLLMVICAVGIGTAASAGAINAGNGELPDSVSDEITLVKQAPVVNVDGAAYTNYNAIWSSSGNQLIMENGLDGLQPGTTPTHFVDAYLFTIAPSQNVALVTPFVNSISLNAVHPKVRYIFFQMNMPKGVNVTDVLVYSGPTKIVQGSVKSWATGTGGVKDYTLDLGNYYDMVRGINVVLIVKNDLTSAQQVRSYGAGAKQEW